MHRANVSAFSLIEILVVMVLSSFIVGIIYFSYSTLAAYQTRLLYQKRSAEDAATLYFILKKDVQQSTLVRALSQGVVACEYSSGHIKYNFYDHYVLRMQLERSDTFLTDFESLGIYLAGQPPTGYPSLIDEIKLIPREKSTIPSPVVIYKNYDAAALVQLTENDSLP